MLMSGYFIKLALYSPDFQHKLTETVLATSVQASA